MTAEASGPAAPLVSVIIPCRDEETYLPVAVASVRNQSLTDLELIVVDHASTDRTPQLLEELVAADPRIRVVRLEDASGGPGHAMNRGLDEAHGRWVTFVGADDELLPDALADLVAATEPEPVDLVAGRADRIHTAEDDRVQTWARVLFRADRRIARIADEPRFLGDTIAAAKLYRRSLLETHHIRFPVEVMYEDQLFTAEVMLHADGIRVLTTPVYRWMVRKDAVRLSLTNATAATRKFTDRFTVNRLVDDLLVTGGDPSLIAAKQVKFCRHDLRLCMDELESWTHGEREAFAVAAADYTRTLAPEVAPDLPPMVRVTVGMLRQRRLHEARRAWAFRGLAGTCPVDLLEGPTREVYWAEIAEDGADRVWSDVTDLGLHRLPFASRGLTITAPTPTSPERHVVRLTGAVHDPVELSQMADRVGLALIRRSDRLLRVVEGGLQPSDGASGRRYRVEVDLSSLPTPAGADVWDVYLRVGRGEELNYTRLHLGTEFPPLSPVPVEAGEVAWTWQRTQRGRMSLRSTLQSTERSWLSERRAKATRGLGGRLAGLRAALPGGSGASGQAQPGGAADALPSARQAHRLPYNRRVAWLRQSTAHPIDFVALADVLAPSWLIVSADPLDPSADQARRLLRPTEPGDPVELLETAADVLLSDDQTEVDAFAATGRPAILFPAPGVDLVSALTALI